jgi:hypothetical protein
MPMLFVDNAAVHDQVIGSTDDDAMPNVVKWYNALAGGHLYLRTAIHSGAARRYAPEMRGGECTFATASQQMKVHGVVNHDASGATIESFAMDALMEGADQPPFYPFVDIANVNIEPVNRLIGVRNLPVDVSYSPRYTLNGFDPTHNPSELFLDVLGTPANNTAAGSLVRQPIYFGCQTKGGATGGVAKPNALLSVIARQGPIGGKGSATAAEPCCRDDDSSRRVKPPYASALSGRFDPVEYLGAALGGAKLLGIIELKDILKAVLISEAPKLVEEVQYQVSAAEGTVAQGISDALNAIRDTQIPQISQTLPDFLKTIIDKLNSEGGKGFLPASRSDPDNRTRFFCREFCDIHKEPRRSDAPARCG